MAKNRGPNRNRPKKHPRCKRSLAQKNHWMRKRQLSAEENYEFIKCVQKRKGRRCAFCGVYESNTVSKRFFGFPKDEDRCIKWAESSRLPYLKKLGYRTLRNYHVCSDHFVEEDFSSSLRIRLKRDACPTSAKDVNVSLIREQLNSKLIGNRPEDDSLHLRTLKNEIEPSIDTEAPQCANEAVNINSMTEQQHSKVIPMQSFEDEAVNSNSMTEQLHSKVISMQSFEDHSLNLTTSDDSMESTAVAEAQQSNHSLNLTTSDDSMESTVVAEAQQSTMASLKKKWKHLRDCYAREERNRRLKAANPGNKYRRSYAYYDLMIFLKNGGSTNTGLDSGRESEEESKKKQTSFPYKQLQEMRARYKAEFEERRELRKAELEAKRNSGNLDDSRINRASLEFKEQLLKYRRIKPKPAQVDENPSIETCYSIPNLPSSQETESQVRNQSLKNAMHGTNWENGINPELASDVRLAHSTGSTNLVSGTAVGIDTTEGTMFQENFPNCEIKMEVESETEIQDESNILILPTTTSNITSDSESNDARKQVLATSNQSGNTIIEFNSDSDLTEGQVTNNCTEINKESRKRKHNSEQCNKLCQALQIALTANAAERRTDLDSDELFFRYLLLEFKNIPESKKADAKCSLIKLIEDYKTKSEP